MYLSMEKLEGFSKLVKVTILTGLAVASIRIVSNDEIMKLRCRDEAELYGMTSGCFDSVKNGLTK